jgi:uncharacterized membrane protein
LSKKIQEQGKSESKATELSTSNGYGAEIAEELAKRIGSLVPSGQKAQVIAQVVSYVQQEKFSGPIAHPKHLREYEEICPGAADRIISMAENNLEHSHTFESAALNADIKDGQDGRRFGFAAFICIIAAAAFATWLENNALAIAFLGTGVLGVVGQFIQGKFWKKSED